MAEKRYTLRMSEHIFDFAKSLAERNNRSIAKEIEFALARYYLLLPLISTILEDYDLNINHNNLNETRELIKHSLNEIIKNYRLSKQKTDK